MDEIINFIYILLTEDAENIMRFSGIFTSPSQAMGEANAFVRGWDEAEATIVRIDPFGDMNTWVTHTGSLPKGADVVYTISGKMLPE